MDVELRQIAIELLAERSTVEEVDADQSMIERRRCGDGSAQVERRGREAAALRHQRSLEHMTAPRKDAAFTLSETKEAVTG